MKNLILNFEDYDPVFLQQWEKLRQQDALNDKIEDDDAEFDEEKAEEIFYTVKDRIISFLPKSAIFLGAIDKSFEENWNSCRIQYDYYILPLQNDEFDWVIFILRWDDNWGRWFVDPQGRIKGCQSNYKYAALIFLKELWTKWSLNLNDSENESYLEILNSLESEQ